MFRNLCWLLIGERDFRCAMVDQGRAEAYLRRATSDLKLQILTMVDLWEAEQIAAEQFDAGFLAGQAAEIARSQLSGVGSSPCSGQKP